jgi:hypothetical protein
VGKDRGSSDAGKVADGNVVDEYVVAAEVTGFPTTLCSIVVAMTADTVRQR